MRIWSWHKSAIQVNDGSGFVAVFDFEDFWKDRGDQAAEEIAQFIVDACNEKEARPLLPINSAQTASARPDGFVYVDLGMTFPEAGQEAV